MPSLTRRKRRGLAGTLASSRAEWDRPGTRRGSDPFTVAGGSLTLHELPTTADAEAACA